jgi:hypothetical protein
VLRKQALEGDLLRERARLAQLDSDIAGEQGRLAGRSSQRLSLPAGHGVWATMASSGTPVAEGQAIMDLADCERRFVTVELLESDFDNILPGRHAGVRLRGSETWIAGTVEQVVGSAAPPDERRLAAGVAKPEGRRVAVEIRLPPDPLSMRDGRYCDIGRRADVRLERPGSAPFSGLSGKITLLGQRFGFLDKTLAATDDGGGER